MDVEKKTRKNEEESQSKIPYPFQIFFIISMEACERFSYYGMNSELPALLIDQAHFHKNVSAILTIYLIHLFERVYDTKVKSTEKYLN